MKNAQLHLRMLERIMVEGTRDSLRAGHREVIDIVRLCGAGKIDIHHAAREIGAIASDAIEVIYIFGGVEIGDQRKILFLGGLHHENVKAARNRRAHHLAPFRLVAGAAGFAGAIFSKEIIAVAFLEQMLDFLRADHRAIRGIFDAVQEHAQRHDIPLHTARLRRA